MTDDEKVQRILSGLCPECGLEIPAHEIYCSFNAHVMISNKLSKLLNELNDLKSMKRYTDNTEYAKHIVHLIENMKRSKKDV